VYSATQQLLDVLLNDFTTAYGTFTDARPVSAFKLAVFEKLEELGRQPKPDGSEGDVIQAELKHLTRQQEEMLGLLWQMNGSVREQRRCLAGMQQWKEDHITEVHTALEKRVESVSNKTNLVGAVDTFPSVAAPVRERCPEPGDAPGARNRLLPGAYGPHAAGGAGPRGDRAVPSLSGTRASRRYQGAVLVAPAPLFDILLPFVFYWYKSVLADTLVSMP